MMLLSIDPGESSAVSLLEWSQETAPVLRYSRQAPGGIEGFLAILEDSPEYDTVICEKFSPRPSNVAGFQQSLKTTLPLVCEGVLIGRRVMPVYTPGVKEWVQPDAQYLVGGKDKADKKKRQHKFLKESGFYVTGKQLNAPDADDARSAIAHGISYLARVKKHEPSYRLIADWIEKNGN